MKEFIKFTVAPYALIKVLDALTNNGINNISVTQQDSDLMVSINRKETQSLIYGTKTMAEMADDRQSGTIFDKEGERETE